MGMTFSMLASLETDGCVGGVGWGGGGMAGSMLTSM